MTLRHLAAVQTFRDILVTETSANGAPQKGTYIVPTGRKIAGPITPTGYGTSIIPRG